MAESRPQAGGEVSDITLGLLTAIDRNSAITQRGVAKDLGIALGLANAYLKRCATKGLIKIAEAPANRYAYYLTPKGFAEKSRLTAAYLSQSFNLFRRARVEYGDIMQSCVRRGYRRVALIGASDLAEIALLCARDVAVEIVGTIGTADELAGLSPLDAVIITDLSDPQKAYDELTATLRPDQVFAPSFLNVSHTMPAANEG